MNKFFTYMVTCIFFALSFNAHARFTQSDTWPGDEIEPSTLHKYTYGSNNPVNNIDPSGQMTLNELMEAINVQGIQATTGNVSYRLVLRKLGEEFACISIQNAVTDIIMEELTGGIYIFLDQNNKKYIGMTNDFERRIAEHSKDQTRKLKKVLAMFHMDFDKNDARVVEQFFIDAYGGTSQTANTINSIAEKPRSIKSQNLRKMVNKLKFCR